MGPALKSNWEKKERKSIKVGTTSSLDWNARPKEEPHFVVAYLNLSSKSRKRFVQRWKEDLKKLTPNTKESSLLGIIMARKSPQRQTCGRRNIIQEGDKDQEGNKIKKQERGESKIVLDVH